MLTSDAALNAWVARVVWAVAHPLPQATRIAFSTETPAQRRAQIQVVDWAGVPAPRERGYGRYPVHLAEYRPVTNGNRPVVLDACAAAKLDVPYSRRQVVYCAVCKTFARVVETDSIDVGVGVDMSFIANDHCDVCYEDYLLAKDRNGGVPPSAFPWCPPGASEDARLEPISALLDARGVGLPPVEVSTPPLAFATPASRTPYLRWCMFTVNTRNAEAHRVGRLLLRNIRGDGSDRWTWTTRWEYVAEFEELAEVLRTSA